MELEDLSIVEKAAMLSGGSEWDSRGNDRADIPGFVMSDGPHGVRRQLGEGDHLGIGASKPATCFPTAGTVANSWDPALAQVVNFFVQMKWVFKSDSSFKDAAWKYVILAVIIVVVNLVLPGYVTGLCQGWGMGAGIAGTIASVVNTLLAVIVSYPLLKFWVMPKNKDSKEAAK